MAGIGFELRKLMRSDTLLGLMQTYAYAGIISSGPWVLSILGILVIGLLSLTVVVPDLLITQFQVSVTWLIAVSLILTGVVQLAFTRFTADRHFEKRDDAILPAFNGLLFIQTLTAGLLGVMVVTFLFHEQSVMYRLLMLTGFVVICDIWLAAIFLSSMKQYKGILWLFALGYSTSVGAALLLRSFALEGLLGGFVLGQFVLLMGMMVLTLRSYPSEQFVDFDFGIHDGFLCSRALHIATEDLRTRHGQLIYPDTTVQGSPPGYQGTPQTTTQVPTRVQPTPTTAPRGYWRLTPQ